MDSLFFFLMRVCASNNKSEAEHGAGVFWRLAGAGDRRG
jgi:hypothetical protein